MKPEARANPNRAMAMTRPRNQSAFQKAVFMSSPGFPAARGNGPAVSDAPSYQGRAGVSPADIDLLPHALGAGETRELRVDDQVLHRHALGFEERDLLLRGT